MKETMANAQGVGLAAPQIGKAIRLFLIDASPFAEDEDLSAEDRAVLKGFKHTFINAKIIESDIKYEFFGKFQLTPSDFDIELPSFLSVKMKDLLDFNFRIVIDK